MDEYQKEQVVEAALGVDRHPRSAALKAPKTFHTAFGYLWQQFLVIRAIHKMKYFIWHIVQPSLDQSEGLLLQAGQNPPAGCGDSQWRCASNSDPVKWYRRVQRFPAHGVASGFPCSMRSVLHRPCHTD